MPTLRLLPLLLLLTPHDAMCKRKGLHRAAEEGDLAPLKVAIEGRYDEYEGEWRRPDLDAPNSKGRVPLHLAVCNHRRDLEAVKALLDKGAGAGTFDGAGETPLHLVARGCGNERQAGWDSGMSAVPSPTQVARLLLKHGADIDAAAKNEEALTPLHHAAGRGSAKLVEVLLGKGASVDSADASGATPLHHAARAGLAGTVLALVKAGADPAKVDGDGKTARDAVTGRDSASSSIRAHLDGASKIFADALEGREQAKRDGGGAKKKKSSSTKAEL